MDRREIARREALQIWLEAARQQRAAPATGMDPDREAELAFDRWWSRTSRRALQAKR